MHEENMTKSSYLHFIDRWAAVAVYTDTLPYTSLVHAHRGITTMDIDYACAQLGTCNFNSSQTQTILYSLHQMYGHAMFIMYPKCMNQDYCL